MDKHGITTGSYAMSAQLIVSYLLEGNSYYPAFDGDGPYGYLGTVNTDGAVRATRTDLTAEHQRLGYSFHDARWRYAFNRNVPTVCWSSNPTKEQQNAVEEWLRARGHPVAGHTDRIDKWYWP